MQPVRLYPPVRNRGLYAAFRKDEGILDEIPAAYKPIDQVMANQADLVEVVATLKPVICVKG
ncbi:RtcB family protein [Thermostichus vulcanus]|uniref:RtcB family protein n=1 Tax=Thermostichus vulcanus TaxID=32053 RepID=UPI003CC67597